MRPPPYGPKFFRFHAVFGDILQNRMSAPPPGELAPPPMGNPGCAPNKHMVQETDNYDMEWQSTNKQQMYTDQQIAGRSDAYFPWLLQEIVYTRKIIFAAGLTLVSKLCKSIPTFIV